MRAAPFLICFVAGIASAQDLQGYLQQRNKLGISQSASVAALETLVGQRTTEIKGIVKGTIRIGDGGMIMVETMSGTPISVNASPIPGWLQSGNVTARMIVRASREHDAASLKADLVAAALDSQVSAWEKQAAKPAQKNPSGLSGPIGSKAPSSNPATRPTPAPTKDGKTWYVPASDAVPFYRDFIQKQNRRLTKTEAEKIARGVIGFSLQYGVDARLVMAMIMVESGFNPRSTSRSGAMGLGQLMPSTARGLGVSNAYDSMDNLYGMVKLIRGHIDKYTAQTGGDEYRSLVLMLAAYNAGSGAVSRHGGVPPYRETQNYVRKVTSLYQQLCGQ
ncbi:MAG: lytic transglycosylase domain-containing protein [Fimbriimonadaceae bacterium]|nr:lytic transglycosylase domain-containing protein [Fimbriimonadaceae bacterium]